MLPEAIANCYVRYKGYEAAILSWVVSVSNACGFRKVYPGSQRVADACKAPGAPRKYTISRDEILVRVDLIVNSKKPNIQVPMWVTNYLTKSIADRERCSAWFQEHYAGDSSVEDSTEMHIHFTILLKRLLSMLQTISEPSKPSPTQGCAPPRTIVNTGNVIEVKPRFSDLHVSDLDTEIEGSDSSDDPSAAIPGSPLDYRADNREIYEAEPTETDRLLAMYEMLRELELIRKHIKEIWSKYHGRRISLIHATIITNSAIDCVKNLEAKFATSFPESPVWEDLADSLFPEIIALWNKDPSLWSPKNIEDMDMIFLTPMAMLKVFRDVYEPDGFDWIKTWLPDVNKIYDPRLDVSKLSSQEKLKRSIILLDAVLPEQALNVKIGLTSSRDRITTGFRDLLETKRVRLWVSFSFQILCDIHLILGEDLYRPFNDLRLHIERARRENTDWVQNTDNGLIHETRREYNRKVVDFTDSTATEDTMFRMRKIAFEESQYFGYVAHAQKPYFLSLHQPLMPGSMAVGTRLRWQDQAIQIADRWYYVSAVLHLHSALKQEHCLPAVLPFLESLEDLYGMEKVFFGRPPTTPRAYKNHYLLILGFSVQWFAANKRKCVRSRSKISQSKRARDLTDLRPLLRLLEKEYSWSPDKELPQLTEFMEVIHQYRLARHGKVPRDKTRPWRDEIFSDPIVFLSTLSEWLDEEQPRIDFDYYRAHNICWRLLRRIEASPRIRKPFREEYEVDDSELDQCLKYIPSFIFSRNIKDPKGMWMQSVGETVDKFFREENAKEQSAEPELDDPTDVRYAPGYKMGRDIEHPEKDGKCCHVGVCELQVVHWRLQAGLSPWEEGDEDGEWWKGLRVDLTEDEAKAVADPAEPPSPSSSSSPPLPAAPEEAKASVIAAPGASNPPLDINPEEILAMIPPEGITTRDLLIHFKERMLRCRVAEVRELLLSVARYDPSTKTVHPLE